MIPHWFIRAWQPRPLMTVWHPDGKRKLEVLPPLAPEWQVAALALLSLSVISEVITICLEGPWNAWSWLTGVVFGVCMGNIGRLIPRTGTNSGGAARARTEGEAP